ncbi:uncharacterized protein MONOS_13732 [Monocercomonoides exilis]|uniref:uncharacterized protein n=1 Tax=Monocercomonoides exilis TaxID=2049356 RepID=UPI0035594344|nr:hypothetical protein MONOS_13732 [Monocercomonoides exilis]
MTTSGTERFNELFSELEDCDENGQKRIIEEMNKIVYEMNEEEFKSVFTKELFYKMNKMIEDKKLSMGNVLLLLKRVGYCKVLKNAWTRSFKESSLNKRFEQMIIAENKKIDEKDEKLLVDLCECFFSLSFIFNHELLSICVPCLVKAALKKEESVEARNEVEIAFLALHNIGICPIEQELYMNEIKEIIKYHQEHRNLSHLAYRCAWKFLIDRLYFDENLEEVIVNDLHFAREAAREIEELTRNVDWKREKEEESEEELALLRWIESLNFFFEMCKLQREEFSGLIGSIVQVFQATKEKCNGIHYHCVYLLETAAGNKAIKVEAFVKGGAVDAVFQGIQLPALNEKMAYESLVLFLKVSRRLKEEEDDEMEEAKRKASKRKVTEKMEEEGYEDIITSFHEKFDFLNRRYYHGLSLNISDYFISV